MFFSKRIFSPFRIIEFLFLFLLFFAIVLVVYLMSGSGEFNSDIDFGVSFSQVSAEQMEIDWRKAYSSILDDLGVKKFRLIAYWQKIETNKGEYVFDDLDWQINEAEKRGAEVVLAVGQKLPRWPECHIPDWARDLSKEERENEILSMLTEVVEHYQDNDTIKYWQVENEPFLINFGECPEFDENFLAKEIALVRKLDKKRRPVILTASGELSSWTKPATYGDVLGTTLYRIVWSDILERHVEYPIPAVFYNKRANYIKRLTGIDKVIIIELQAEPWSHLMIYENTLEEQFKTMDLDRFKEIIDYTYETGFDEAYLWGVEWWYWIRENHDIDTYWLEAQKLWDN